MKLPTYISPSALNGFLSCPYRWKCSKTLEYTIKTDDSAALFGSAIHNIIQLYYSKIDNTITKKDIIPNLDQAFIEGGNWITDSQKAKSKRMYKNIITFEQDRINNKRPKPDIIERRFNSKLFEDLPPFHGIVDCYTSETKIALDWKTGKNTELDDEKMVQGKIYEMLLEKNGYDVDRVVFCFLNTGAEPTIPKVNEGWIYSKAKMMCDMIEADRFPSKPSGLCRFCPYQLACQYKNKCRWCI